MIYIMELERMIMSKDDIIVEIYQNTSIVRYCKSISNEWEELKSQLIIQLMKMKDDKLFVAKEKGYLEYLCFTICKRIVYGNVSGTGIFYKSSRNVSFEEGFGADIEIEESQDDRLDLIEGIVNSKHWYEKTLFNYHYKDGYKLREIAEITGINLKSIAYTIDKTRKEIKKRIQDGNNNNNG